MCPVEQWGENSFAQIPAAVIGTSAGQIGTAMAQQSLRGVLSFCNARQMTSPEAYIRYSPEIFPGDGEVTDESTKTFLPTTWNSSSSTSFGS
jgi:chromate reductase